MQNLHFQNILQDTSAQSARTEAIRVHLSVNQRRGTSKLIQSRLIFLHFIPADRFNFITEEETAVYTMMQSKVTAL